MSKIILFLTFLFILQPVISVNPTCNNKECQLLAQRILSNMNESVDPCDDFYEFACGNYDNRVEVPQHVKRMFSFVEIEQDLDNHLYSILVNSSRENATKSMKLALNYFDSCMDNGTEDIQPLLDLISSLGGWGLLDNSTSKSTWEALAGQISNHGVQAIINPTIRKSLNNRETHTLMVDSLKLLLKSDKFYKNNITDNEHLQYYQQYMTSFLKLLGDNGADDSVFGILGANNTEEEVNNVIEFERSLAKISTSQNTDEVISNLMTYGELRAKYKGIKWDDFFDKDIKKSLGGMKNSMVINVLDPGFFEDLGELVKSTSEETIKNYLMWRLVQSYNEFLPSKYQEPLDAFGEKVQGVGKQPTWQRCVNEVRDKLSMPLATGFLQEYFTQHDKSVAEEMVKDLKETMEEELKIADWIDEPTKRAALIKLELMETRIGYPDYLFNETAILLPFKGVLLELDQYFENAVELRKSIQSYNLAELHRKPQVDWLLLLLYVNAAEFHNYNEMVFPAGILQFPLFVPDAPGFVNYGAMGIIIGHEITHNYDTIGAQYDEHGNQRNWWDNQTRLEFENRTQCFIDQYNQQIEPMTGRKINGKLTVSENIADNGGVRIAYQAYLKKLQREQNYPKLPGLEKYNSKQMFFISHANLWCDAMKPTAKAHKLDTDVHGPSNVRVNVPFQNLPEFSEEFECAKDAPMNARDKCRIW